MSDPSSTRRIHVVGAALLRRAAAGMTVLAARRAPHVAAAGKWEFPGGKIEDGETPRKALRRELLEEMDLELRTDEIGEHLGRGSFRNARVEIVLDVYTVSADVLNSEGWTPVLKDHDRVRWLDADTLLDVAWAEADLPVLPKLRDLLIR